jgi:transcriptional regulator with XRE-family HTH domain
VENIYNNRLNTKEEKTMTFFTKAIKSILLERDINNRELAEKLGTSRQNLGSIINGSPTLRSLIKISSALNIPLSKIVLKAEALKEDALKELER